MKCQVRMAQWLSWLERRPVTAEVTGSSPVWVVRFTVKSRFAYRNALHRFSYLFEILQPLQVLRSITGVMLRCLIYYVNQALCRRGGIGRRPGLKIPWVVIPVPVRPRSPALPQCKGKAYK